MSGTDGAPPRTQGPDRRFVDPGLLNVVPWTYGFAHSWALRALLIDERTSPLIVNALSGLPGREPHHVEGEIRHEEDVKPARADLAFAVRDASGTTHEIAVETKVNDPFQGLQMKAYRLAKRVPVLFLPGLTGLLLEPTDPVDEELRLYGHQVHEALEGEDLKFGSFLGGYLAALRVESQRMDRARAAARGDSTEEIGEGRASRDDVLDHAWLAEVYRTLPKACERTGIPPKAQMRVERYDRGFFFEGSYNDVGEQAGLYVDLFATIGGHVREVAIKADGANLADAWDRAFEQRDLLGNEWRRSRRSVGGQSAKVLKRSLVDLSAVDAAEEAVRAAQFIKRVAHGA